MSIIKVENISKKYIIGHNLYTEQYRGSLREAITGWGTRLYRRVCNPWQDAHNETESEDFWALKDINFEVKQGERLGIIGKNGSGKSTLLKILSRITQPSSGSIKVRGKVASLLEVGTGFHPDLTGRENIFLNGAILGLKRNEIKRKFDEIVDFSEIEKFIDTPVKRYSSGMYVRLAFAVAAHMEPEILLIDEVLSVGDMAFQKKSLTKMEAVCKNEGRTLLFVSHSMSTVTSLCSRVIFLEQGKIAEDGDPSWVAAKYFSDNAPPAESCNTEKEYEREPIVYGDDFAELINVELLTMDSQSWSGELTIDDAFKICMTFRIKQSSGHIPVPNFHFLGPDDGYVFVDCLPSGQPLAPGVYRATCDIPANFLNSVSYYIGVALTTFGGINKVVNFFDKHALQINVIEHVNPQAPRRNGYDGLIPGSIRPCLNWNQERIS